MKFIFLRNTFFVLCPLHQDVYRSWCYLCSKVSAYRDKSTYISNIPWWYHQRDEDDPMNSIMKSKLKELSN